MTDVDLTALAPVLRRMTRAMLGMRFAVARAAIEFQYATRVAAGADRHGAVKHRRDRRRYVARAERKARWP